MTRINPEDPKWTAYVLGELDDTERAAIELELEASEEARTLVEELRFAVQMTKTELREAVPAASLTELQREAIYASSDAQQPRRWFTSRQGFWAAGLAVATAAVVVLAVIIAPEQETIPLFAPAAMPAAPEYEKQLAGQTKAETTETDSSQLTQDFGLRYGNASAPTGTSEKEQSLKRALPDNASSTVVETQSAPPAPGLDVISPRLVAPLPAPPVIVEPAFRERAQNALLPTQAAKDVEAAAPQDSLLPGNNNFRQELQGQQGQQGQLPQQIGRLLAPSAPLVGSRAPGVPRSVDRPFGRINGNEAYDGVTDNPFLTVTQNPLSTFAIDVDTASYSNVRRILNQNQRPPRDAVRIEELINYFNYDYPQPAGINPIGAAIEAGAAPWNPQHRLVRVAIKARDMEAQRRPASNLVFLLDVSGSMQPQERLPLLKDGLRLLVQQLTANDRVTVVTYAGTTGVALRATRGDQKDAIQRLIDSLQAGGSTNGASGIQLAYEQAAANFITGGVNRVILATDGDFNVGITDRNSLLRLIEDKAKSGVFLSVLGVGMGNYKDATLEMLADKGHGNYAYIDTLNEARKVLVEQMSGTLVTMAKDVKVQVEFNPAVVDAYRLIGYENRALRNEDFNNDLKDGGDMGAGHTVTVLYEVVPRGVAINAPGLDPLKYQQPAPAPPAAANASNETLTVKIRYKEPTASDSKLLIFPLVDREQAFARSSADFRFAAAVASFGMILRDSPYKGTATFDSVMSIAEDSLGADRNGYRREFLQLVGRARQIRIR